MTELELYHHGIKGQKWGIRRYQNSDGTLTAAGKKKYGDSDGKSTNKKKSSKTAKKYTKSDRRDDEIVYGKRGVKRIEKRMKKGDSHLKAEIKEIGRRSVESMLLTAVIADATTDGYFHKTTATLAKNTVKNAINQYTYQKAMQKTNASLAKIGTMTLKHVAGDVYETVMK